MIIRDPFRGLNTDVCPTRLPSGVADIATNIVVENGELKRRAGFSLKVDIGVAVTPIVGVWDYVFSNGGPYTLCKFSDGTLKYWVNVGSTFTNLTTPVTHASSDVGWSFFWRDRVHYFDSGGGTKITPAAIAYKAGLPKPQPHWIAAAPGGQKEGRYHTHFGYYDERTREMGVCSGPGRDLSVNGPCEARASAATGGIAAVLPTDHTDREFTHYACFCTMGSTEYQFAGSVGVEIFSSRAMFEMLTPKGFMPGFSKADSALDPNSYFDDAGGEPPAAGVGMFTGNRAIYGNIRKSGATVGDLLMFSIPNQPCMVPQEVSHRFSNNLGTIENWTIKPKPWIGEASGGFQGTIRAMCYGGGVAAVFTDSSCHVLRPTPDGRLFPVKVADRGCVSPAGVAGTPRGIHFVDATGGWSVLGPDGLKDLSTGHFKGAADFTAAKMPAYAMAYYPAKDQVWMACSKGSEQRILIYDYRLASGTGQGLGGVLVWTPAFLRASETISAMCASADGTGMWAATNQGRLYKYTDSTAVVQDNSVGYACQYRAHYAQEAAPRDLRLDRIMVFGGTLATKVTVGYRAMRHPDETVTQETYALQKANATESISSTFQKREGRFFQLDFTSPNTDSSMWTVRDMILHLNPTSTQ